MPKTEDIDPDKCYVIPVGPGVDIFISGDFPFHPVEADRFMAIIAAMMPGLIDPDRDRLREVAKPKLQPVKLVERSLVDKPADLTFLPQVTSHPTGPNSEALLVLPPSANSLHATSEVTVEDGGQVIEDVADGTYVVWAKVASRLESLDIDMFRCTKKTSSVHSVVEMMSTKYPFLKCTATKLPKEMSRLEVSRRVATSDV
jgi:hypothetical protein